ncbi:MAG: response regulator [Desulfitobacterium sp.]
MKDSTRVILVDDHPVYRNGLKQSLERDPRLKVVAEASEGKEALEKIITLHPDVVISDYRLIGDLDGIKLLAMIKASNIDTRFILLSAFDEEDILLTAISAGADGYLLKDADATDIRKAIQGVVNGGAVLSPSLTRKLFPIATKFAETQKHFSPQDGLVLTSRENQVLSFLRKGCSDKEIAQELNISLKTVHNHNMRIFQKFKVTSRRQLIK